MTIFWLADLEFRRYWRTEAKEKGTP